MAGEDLNVSPGGGSSGRWRGALASAAALVATILLAALLFMVAQSNAARDEALASERHSYDVMLMTRTVDGTIARAEATLGRYVLDEKKETGVAYYQDWVLAGQQITSLKQLVGDNPGQTERVERLSGLYARRDAEFAAAARAAAQGKGTGGIPLFYAAAKSGLGGDIRSSLDAIAAAERVDLRARMETTRRSSDQADKLTVWFGWLAVLIGLGALIAGFFAFKAMRERIDALAEADSEATRAGRLEQAVRERTHELTEANARLKAEAAEREAAEARLRQVQKMEAVGQLTGGIAHDFNNMLAVVVGGLDLARRRLTGPRREVEFHLDNAMEGATRAAALTRRLLAFARAEPLLPTSVAPAALVQGMLDLVDRSIGERIQVRTRFPEHPWAVSVDTSQLENAILNLAVNARDAMENGGELTIAVSHCTLAEGEVSELAAGDYVRISVSDTGEGMSAEVMERVFEPFFPPIGRRRRHSVRSRAGHHRLALSPARRRDHRRSRHSSLLCPFGRRHHPRPARHRHPRRRGRSAGQPLHRRRARGAGLRPGRLLVGTRGARHLVAHRRHRIDHHRHHDAGDDRHGADPPGLRPLPLDRGAVRHRLCRRGGGCRRLGGLRHIAEAVHGLRSGRGGRHGAVAAA